MSELISVGLDVGTTTTQMVVSKLVAQNKASAFAVPRMEITEREILYESPIHFTPLLSEQRIDGEGIRRIVEEEYRRAGITPDTVDTGAVIITGETSRKENAQAVVHGLAAYAGDFVVATAGPDLESVLAAKGAGAVALSERRPVLHFDIGGGTSNLALCVDGKVVATGCLNVGGRLLKFDGHGRVTYVSPVLQGRQWASHREIAGYLASILEMAAGLREKTEDYLHFLTAGTEELIPPKGALISFSGGVADCIAHETESNAYGDLGPMLGTAIRESRLCQVPYRIGNQTIRATVIGAGCHSAQLSGSTIFLQNTALPKKNLPVAVVTEDEQARDDLRQIIRQRLKALDGPGALFLPGWQSPPYSRVTALADALAEFGCPIVLEADMAKALGNALALRLSGDAQILCVDGLHIPEGSFLDLGAPAGSAITAIVKTLVFEQ